MFNLEKIDFDESTYKSIIKNDKGEAQKGQKNTFKHYDEIIQQIKNYLTYAPKTELLTSLSDQIDSYTEDGLHDTMYKYYNTNVDLKEKIKQSAIDNPLTFNGNVCPYCGIKRNSLRDLDHFLPRQTFPEFSILSNNLIYVCATCNQRPNKGTKILDANSNRQFLNPYYDTLDDLEILKCRIKNKDIIISIEFYINEKLEESHNYLYTIAKNHMKELNLYYRYSNLATNDLLNDFIHNFTDLDIKNYKKIETLTVDKCQNYIQIKIKEIIGGVHTKNNFALVFWQELMLCTDYFLNLSERKL